MRNVLFPRVVQIASETQQTSELTISADAHERPIPVVEAAIAKRSQMRTLQDQLETVELSRRPLVHPRKNARGRTSTNHATTIMNVSQVLAMFLQRSSTSYQDKRRGTWAYAPPNGIPSNHGTDVWMTLPAKVKTGEILVA